MSHLIEPDFPGPPAPDPEAPVLVAILPQPADLARARAGWYRIPVTAPVRRLGADYLAFYQTGAFPPDERWAVHYYAPVLGYHIVTRRELIPDEPDHPRADVRYYRIDLGPLIALPRPIPSRSLRRITFIPTTLERLLCAREINELWLKTPARQRLWDILEQARLEAEIDYPLVDDLAEGSELDDVPFEHVPTADFALTCREGRIALLLAGEPATDGTRSLSEPRNLGYLLARGNWHAMKVPAAGLWCDDPSFLTALTALVDRLGGVLPCVQLCSD